jgi:1-acyl-sn-glycerol-3-phosphate acyltransferase
VLLVLNHPNGLLDPLLAVTLLNRPPRFVAKAALWKLLPLRPLLAFFGAIPVQRAQDAGGSADPEALAATFTAVFESFNRGEVVGIFPEGISHAGNDLAPLKTGPARMLLGAPRRPLLVPAGLVYGDRGIFRHSALLRLGDPIPTADLAGTDPGTVLALTARIRAALYPLTLHHGSEETYRLAQDLAWLLAEAPRPQADLAQFQARVRVLQDWLVTFADEERPGLAEQVKKVMVWLGQRQLRPDQVGHSYPLTATLRWLPKATGRFLLALLCLPAGLLYWPAYRLVAMLSQWKDPDPDVVATTKLLAGALLLPLWSAGLLALGWFWFGLPAVWVWALAVPAALVCLPLLEALREDRHALRGWLARNDPGVPELLEAREQLLIAVPRLRETFKQTSGGN